MRRFPMKKKKSLLQKLDGLLRKFPKFLHHFGPKTYTARLHLKCLLLMEKLNCSFSKLYEFLHYFGVNHPPERSTLIKFRKRLPAELWDDLLKASAGLELCEMGAIDSTGFSRSNASSYFVKRIDRDIKTQRHLQLSIYVAVKERKVLSARLRAQPVHDNNEVSCLLKKSPCIAEVNLMDKAYDSNKTHALFRDRGKYSIIAVRKNCARGQYRKEMRDYFDYGLYWQRNIVESINSSVKRVYGSVCRGKTITTQRGEVYARLILHNLSLAIARLFHQSREERNLFIEGYLLVYKVQKNGNKRINL